MKFFPEQSSIEYLFNGSQYISRDFRRTVDDDFILNVQDRVRKGQESVELVAQEDGKNIVVGWKIQNQYE